MIDTTTLEQNLAQLKRDGYLLIPQALAPVVVEQWKAVLYDLYERKQYEISNGVGNVAFEKLLLLQPELAKGLMGHASTSPYLKAILGKQCQQGWCGHGTLPHDHDLVDFVQWYAHTTFF